MSGCGGCSSVANHCRMTWSQYGGGADQIEKGLAGPARSSIVEFLPTFATEELK